MVKHVTTRNIRHIVPRCTVSPDWPDVVLRRCWRDTALSPTARTGLALPGLLLSPEQNSLSVWRPGWFSPLAWVFRAG